MDEVVVELLERELGAPLDPPKRAEFHLAKRLLKEAEELPARGSMSSLRKTWGAAQKVKVVKKGKELKSAAARQRNSRRRQRRHGAAPTPPPRLLRAGHPPPGDVKYAIKDVEQFVERFEN